MKKRILFTLALCGVIALGGRAVLGDRGFFEVWRKKSAFRELSGQVQALREENLSLTREIQALRSDPLAIERIAREELGYSRPGEITFIFREDQGPQLTAKP